MRIRKIRRNQAVTPFGVGAIIDVLGESFVAMDTHRWKQPEPIRAERLAAALNIEGIQRPPSAPDSRDPLVLAGAPGLPFYRFPTWLFCPSCRRLHRRFPRDETGDAPRCGSCNSKRSLVPMRFVMICSAGHLQDVDWMRWAHSKGTPAQKQCADNNLRFKTLRRAGGGLDSLLVECATCRASRNLKGITNPGAAASAGLRCWGGQPWIFRSSGSNSPACAEEPVIVQRGASSVHFPLVRSAIDIPPYSNFDYYGTNVVAIKASPFFQAALNAPNQVFRDTAIGQIVIQCRVTEELVNAVLRDQGRSASGGPASLEDASDAALRLGEWKALIHPGDTYDPRDNFVVEERDLGRIGGDAGPRVLLNDLSQLVAVLRLREVRALAGFYRHKQDQLVEPDLGLATGARWFPGIEVFGEGIFFRLDEDGVQTWERRRDVRERSDLLRRRVGNVAHLSKWLPLVTPRLVLLHTLAHLLIRQLTYETGYSSASLRERIYEAPSGPDTMAGVLIYTSAGDSEGTLGGLVRQAEPSRFVSTLSSALVQATWCSFDPVCSESKGQGLEALALAACHGCALVSETSCEYANVLLDRELVVGDDLGFFAGAVAELMSDQSEAATSV